MTEESDHTLRQLHNVEDLAAAVRDASGRIDANRVAMENRIKVAYHKVLWWKIGSVIAGILGVVGLAVGYQGNLAAEDAHDAVEQVQAQRRDAIINNCEQDNINAELINGLNDRTQGLLITIATANSEPRPPEEQARVDEILARELAAFEAVKVPVRDCSLDALDLSED